MKMTRRDLAALLSLAGATAFKVASGQTPDSSPASEANEKPSFIAGNLDLLPVAESTGELTVVAHSGLLPLGELAYIVRNDTDKTLSEIRMKVEARSQGKLIGVSDSSEFQPATLDPGDYGLGFFMLDSRLDPNSEFSFKLIESEEGADDRYLNLEFGEINKQNGQLIGELVNSTSGDIEFSTVLALNLTSDGSIIGSAREWVNEIIPAGESTSFAVGFYDNSVNYFVIAGSGRWS